MASAAMRFGAYTAQPVNPLRFQDIQNAIFFSKDVDHNDSSRSAPSRQRSRNLQAIRKFKRDQRRAENSGR